MVKLNSTQEIIGTDVLDHLGLVAATIDKLAYQYLKQMTLLLATTGASGFPVWMESHSGNASDKKTLEESAQRMQKFCKALESAPSLLYVGDSAMYTNCVNMAMIYYGYLECLKI